MTTLLDHRGQPIKSVEPTRKSATFIEALSRTEEPAMQRARDAYSTHAYVYAAATAIALNLSQVELGMFMEAPQASANRTLRAGDARSTRSRINSPLRTKAMERVYTDPISMVLNRPNEVMVGASDLIVATALFLTLRGEALWLPRNGVQGPWLPGQPFDRILVLHPDNLREKVDSHGSLAHWDYTISRRDHGLGLGAAGTTLRFSPGELIHFKYFNPEYPLRGISRLTATAAGIIQDLMAVRHNTSLLQNNAEPAGFLISQTSLHPDEKAALITGWNSRFGGPENRRKIGVLDGGIDFKSLALTNTDMQAIELRKWNREEILAVMGVPKSVVSVDENLNYSIQLSQDRNFWTKCLIPLARLIENVLDSTLMYGELDNKMLVFDTSKVEALQDDLSAKVTTATQMMNQGRVSPRVAYEKVGIEMPDQPGMDEVLVTGLLTPIQDLLGTSTDAAPVPEPLPPVDPVVESPTLRLRDVRGILSVSPITRFASRRNTTTVSFRAKATRKAKVTALSYRRLIAGMEKPTIRTWKAYISQLRGTQLDLFDVWAEGQGAVRSVTKASMADVDKILFDMASANSNLKAKFRPRYNEMADAVVEFTRKELDGLHVFDIESPEATAFMNSRTSKVTGVNDTIRTKLRNSLNDGITNGESLSELRGRIVTVFKRQVSEPRATTIARTEVAQTFGGIRDLAFDKEGITQSQWTTAGDDHVREDHTTFGSSGPQDRGTNYMELVGRGKETLLFPSDPDGPADQVINCRCVEVALG